MPTGIYAPGTGGKGTGLHPVDTRDSNNDNLSRESLIRHVGGLNTPPVTSGLIGHFAARLENFSDGDAVGTFTDREGTTGDVTQSTSSAKPTYKTNVIGGLPVLRFDGSDDEMTGSTISAVSQPYTFIMVGAHISGANTPYTDGTDGTNRYHAVFTGNGEWSYFFGGSVVNSGTATDTANHIWTTEANGGSSFMELDGSQILSGGSPGTDSYVGLHLASNTPAGATTFANFDLAEILIYNDSLTASEITELENWLNNTVGYGIF